MLYGSSVIELKWKILSDQAEGKVLFNDELNTFYLRLYCVKHVVNDHSDSERGNPLRPHKLLFPISSKGSFICIIPQEGYYMPRPLLHQSWGTGWNEKYLNGSTMKDRSEDPSLHERKGNQICLHTKTTNSL